MFNFFRNIQNALNFCYYSHYVLVFHFRKIILLDIGLLFLDSHRIIYYVKIRTLLLKSNKNYIPVKIYYINYGIQKLTLMEYFLSTGKGIFSSKVKMYWFGIMSDS